MILLERGTTGLEWPGRSRGGGMRREEIVSNGCTLLFTLIDWLFSKYFLPRFSRFTHTDIPRQGGAYIYWAKDLAGVSEDQEVKSGYAIPSFVLTSCVTLVGPLTSAQSILQRFGKEQSDMGQ